MTVIGTVCVGVCVGDGVVLGEKQFHWAGTVNKMVLSVGGATGNNNVVSEATTVSVSVCRR